eukprot:TRINITY_DN6677_c0_g1_i2.p1 TRINITY_DN6677_c0_g1~~TRINITY_DN6677_c0_g1_i2.p1  ORF type:complete len:1668 (+),score=400.29 TRINITY_DN6677_c0_g1_i2:37-5040(+)
MLLSRSQFQQQAFQAIAKCHVQQSASHSRDLSKRLLAFCPSPEAKPFIATIGAVEALKAYCEYVSATKQNSEETINWLLQTLEATKAANAPSRALEAYLSLVIVQLAKLSADVPTMVERVSRAVIFYFGALYQELREKDIRESIYYSLLYGFLDGFAQYHYKWSEKQSRAFLGSFNAMIRSNVHSTLYDKHPEQQNVFRNLILSIYHLLSHPQADKLSKDEYRGIYQLCTDSLTMEKRIGGVSDGRVLGVVLDLLVECGIGNSDLTCDVFDILIGMLRGLASVKLGLKQDAFLGFSNLLQVLSRLVVKKTEYLPAAANEVLQVYTKIASEHTASLRGAFCDSLSKIIQVAIDGGLVDFVRATLSSISNMIPMRGMQADIQNSRAIIDLLAEISIAVNNPLVTAIVSPVFVGLLSNPNISIDKDIMKQLARIAVLEHGQYCIQMVAFLCEIYVQQNETALGVRQGEVPTAFQHLSDGMKDPKLREELRIRVLGLCQAVCHSILTKSPEAQTDSQSPPNRLTVLLPALADLIYDAPANSCVFSDLKFRKNLRNLWIHLTVFGLLHPQKLDTKLEQSIRNIACRIPPLNSKEAGHVEEMLLEVNTVIAKLPTETIQNAKAIWTSLVSLGPAVLKTLSPSKSIYLLSIYYLEVYRSAVDGFKHMMSYLIDAEILDDDDLEVGVKHVADMVFSSNLANMKVGQWSEAHQSRLEDIGQNVIVHHAARIETARIAAQRYVDTLIKTMPQVTMSRTCLQILLDLTEKIAETKKAGKLKVKVLTRAYSFEIEFPDEFSGLDSILNNLSLLCKTWISTCYSFAPEFSKSLLQDHMCTYDGHQMYEHHQTGYSLSVALGFRSSPGHDSPRHRGTFVSELETKVKYTSELRGMMKLLHDPLVGAAISHQHADITTSLATRAIMSLKEILRKHRSGETYTESAYEDVLCRLASLLIINKDQDYSQIIHALCWSPVYLFSEEAVRFATFIWTWLLSARPDLSVSVLYNIANAWSWTVAKGYGLFNTNWTPDFSNPYSESAHKITKLQNPEPHSIILDFLLEQFEVGRLFPYSNLQLFHKVVSSSLKNYKRMSHDPAALGARARLLDLSLKLYVRLYSEQQMSNGTPLVLAIGSVKANIFISRILAAGLNWFQIRPQWQDISDGNSVVENLRILSLFCRKLELIQFDSGAKNPAITIDGQLFLANDVVLNNRKDLLLLLLQNEVDRLIVWYNPRGDPRKAVPEVNFSDAEARFQRSCKTYVNTAWRFSQKLAVFLCQRFAYLGFNSDLERLIMTHTRSLLDCPEALSYLITESSVKKCEPALDYLSLWAPTTPPLAIQYLVPPYTSSLPVLKYAIRTLKSYTPKTILFYVSQLMQVLRYDTGALEDFLVTLSLKSDIFAHRLLWNAQTILDDDVQKSDPSFIAVVDRIRNTILQKFSPASREFYQKEIAFFGKITAISGILKPLHPDKRKEKISEELRKVEILDGVYLPTNPESTVVGINTENPIPLKSHSRVPILVTFKVANSDFVDRPMPAAGSLASNSGNAVRSQGCIFKVDDDVRQDVLATQVIALYKSIFETANLDVFLAPYKVIATGKNMGVIEVVPNASSRDMLGKNSEGSLYNYFLHKYGHKDSMQYAEARHNFISSMAAYAVLSYILQVKDRHNGNILVDEVGHIVHIGGSSV